MAPVGNVLPSSASAHVLGQGLGHDAGADHGGDESAVQSFGCKAAA